MIFWLIAILVLICTGIRVGELTKLMAVDFRSDDGAMRVHGKGHRERIVFIRTLVNESRETEALAGGRAIERVATGQYL